MRTPKLDVYNLVVFYFVASEKSLTAAAEKLFLSQPTVTYHIKSLEQSVGAKLLEIRKKKLFLTQAGEGLFKYSKQIYQQLTNAERFIEELKEASLRVGIALTFSSSFSSTAARFREFYPHVKLIVENAPSFKVIEDVLNSKLDLGIVVSRDYANPELRCIALSEAERMALVASPSSPISQKEQIELADLCDYPLILGPETSATRQIILEKLKAEGFNTSSLIAVEVDSIEWGRSLVEDGKGISFYYMRNVEKEVSEGRLKILHLVDDIQVGVEVLVRRDVSLPPIANKFIALARETFSVPTDALPAGEAAPLYNQYL
jgi:DNA-binding transcriptional LysR family regulator